MRWSVLVLALFASACGNVMSKPAQCVDGKLDGTETDVDCGGGTCAPCAGGKACHVPSDCNSNLCTAGVCAMVPAQCTDGAKDGNETDLDCGGGVCGVCANGKACVTPADCASGSCVNHVCMTPPVQCTDGTIDGAETDVDCGGGTCATCANGKLCQVASDCTSSSCNNHVCMAPPSACRNGTKDGNETDVDCGGDTCVPCPNGKACMIPSDCTSGTCTNHVCSSPVAGCLDNVKDGDETDTDCGGGLCPACSNGKACVAPTDCQSGACINHVCSSPPPMCLNNMKDGAETDVDCGGGTCPACANGKVCSAQSDCQSGSCISGKCASPPAQCLDNAKDGSETDVDCGGGTCPACINGKMCSRGTDCQSGVCDATGKCATPPSQCLNNVRDPNETDVDCGGGTCPACANGKMCNLDGDCVSGLCDMGTHTCMTGGSGGGGGTGGGGGGGGNSCFVTCSAGSQSTCTSTSTSACNGHTYVLTCNCTSQPSCFCEIDGATQGTSIPLTSCNVSLLFNAYSATSGGCGFPGMLSSG